jgi:hypothetical protein
VDDFQRVDSLVLGNDWESMNPGYWMVKNRALRRRLDHVGDQRPTDWFPWHWETHRHAPIPLDYDPSLPFGMAWRRDWQLSDNYSIRIDFTIRAMPDYDEASDHDQDRPGFAGFGLCFGSSCLHESWTGSETGETISLLKSLVPGRRGQEAAWMTLLTDDGRRAQSTSARATMFSTPASAASRSRKAWPPAPMPAMFSFSFGDW